MNAPTHDLPCPHDPCPDPARRWRRCRYLIHNKRWLHPTRDDDMTRECLRYLYDRRACPDAAARRQLARRHPAVAAAHRFFARAAPLQRAELEARLLAGQTDEAIAASCGLAAAAVAAYHALFFDVRDALDAAGYIYDVILGSEVDARLTEDDQEVLLRLLGYAHGPAMVDAALRYFRDPPPPTVCLDGLDGPALAELRQRLQVQVLIQTLVTPACDYTRLELSSLTAAQPQAPGGDEEAALAPTADGPASPADQVAPDQPATAFLRQQMNALAPAGPAAVLPLDRAVLREAQECAEAERPARCG